MALVGVSQLASALGRSKGTISKHADAGKIPVADRDARGAPLFDIDQVRAAYEQGINPLMRRQGEAVHGQAPAPDLEDARELESERRSGARAPGGLQQQLIIEKRLRNRRLAGQLGVDEGRLVPRDVVEDEQTTMARRTRDAVTGFMADQASAGYAFAARPRTEAEWRVWLSERAREAFNHFAASLALEDDDEFDDEAGGHNDGDDGEPEPVAAP